MPYSVELNDVPALSTAFEGEQFLTMIKRQFDRLYAEGAHSGRVMCLAVHPHVIGQPQRTKYLDLALSYLKSLSGCLVRDRPSDRRALYGAQL